jgi:hypothetical protein
VNAILLYIIQLNIILLCPLLEPGNTKGGSITLLLTSCLTALE